MVIILVDINFLSNIKIIDLTKSLAGPIATMILGDLGADVIKIEPLEGDETRLWAPLVDGESVYFMSINRSKRSIALDLKTSEGKEIFYKLVEKADVIIENFRPDVPKRLGVDYESLKRINDKIIYCAIRGFGSDSVYKDKPAYDLLIQAMSGFMTTTGSENDPPVRASFALFDVFTGMMSVVAILTMLLRRSREGVGGYIEVSLYDTSIFSMSYIPMIYLMTGRRPGRYGHAHPSIVPYQAFRCSDNKWIAVAVTNERFWNNLCEALDLKDLCQDPRFKTNPDRVRNRSELIPVLEKKFLENTREYWLKKLEEHDVPAAPVYEIDEVFKDPHVINSGLVISMSHKNLREIKQILLPVKFDERRPSPKYSPPVLGEHTIEILKELGYSEDKIRELFNRKIVR
jgi:formyl-CoA transferase